MNKKTVAVILTFLFAICGRASAQAINMPPSPKEAALMNEIERVDDAAEAALDAGRYAEAEADAQKLLRIDHLPERAEIIMATAYSAEDKDAAALSEYAKIPASPDDGFGIDLPYALLLLRHGQWVAALKVYDIVRPLLGTPFFNADELMKDDYSFRDNDPQPLQLETDIHIALGFGGMDDYGRKGKVSNDRGLAELIKAVQLEPDSGLANLGWAYGLERAGKKDEAKSRYEDVASKYDGDIRRCANDQLQNLLQKDTTEAVVKF